MSDDKDVWRDLEGRPLKFQNWTRVRINRPQGSVGRIDGWVRGCELLKENGVSNEPAYDIHFLGDQPLFGVKESHLERQPEHMQNDPLRPS